MSRYVVLDKEKLKAIPPPRVSSPTDDLTQTFVIRVMKTQSWWKRLFGVKALVADIRLNFVGEWSYNGNIPDYPRFNLHYLHNGEKINEPSVDCNVYDAVRAAWQEGYKYTKPNPWAPIASEELAELPAKRAKPKLPAMKLLKR